MKKSSQRKLKVVVSNAQKLLGKYHKLINNDVKYRDSFPNTEKAKYFGQTSLRYLTNKFEVFEMRVSTVVRV